MFYLLSRIISSVAAFLYPGYASYKTLSQRPASEADIERWLMYWSVLGCIVGVEYVAEWLVSWVPLYYPTKTLFLLYLALPQTRGSSYLYTYHLQPFFHSHETQIDAALASFKARIYTFLQDRVRALWEHISATLGQQQQTTSGPGAVANSGAPPNLGNPVSGPAQLLSALWTSYGPTIINSGNAFLRQTEAAASTQALNSPPIPSAPVRRDTTQSVLERRRQLEAELASLPPHTPPPAEIRIPDYQPSRTSSVADSIRERNVAGMKFEEVDVPSDTEGYDVGGSGTDEGRSPGQRRSSGWFGWATGGGSPSAKGYERVKSD